VEVEALPFPNEVAPAADWEPTYPDALLVGATLVYGTGVTGVANAEPEKAKEARMAVAKRVFFI
jgi:hypothetical protein